MENIRRFNNVYSKIMNVRNGEYNDYYRQLYYALVDAFFKMEDISDDILEKIKDVCTIDNSVIHNPYKRKLQTVAHFIERNIKPE